MSKIRVIVNGVSFYTTKKQINAGVGDYSLVNIIVQTALEECIREGVQGLGKSYTAYDAQLKPIRYNVQINL